MARSWTCHWRHSTWRPDVNAEGEPVRCAGGNNFRKRGVSVGDSVYVVSLAGGQLYLGGRMTVRAVVSRAEAARLTSRNEGELYEADEWIVDPQQTGTFGVPHEKRARS